MVELEAITLQTCIFEVFFHSTIRNFKQQLSLDFSNHGRIRSHHFVKHLQLSVKGLQHRGSYLLYMKNTSGHFYDLQILS